MLKFIKIVEPPRLVVINYVSVINIIQQVVVNCFRPMSFSVSVSTWVI